MTHKGILRVGIGVVVLVALLAGCGMGGGSRLSIEVTTPATRGTVTDQEVLVSGVVSDAEATLLINDEPIDVSADGAYSQTVPLAYGQNRIVIRADKEGSTAAQRTITLTRALVLTVAEPLDQSEVAGNRVVVTGTVSDPAARVTITGDDVEVGADGSFSYEVVIHYLETVLNVTAHAVDTEPVSQLVTVRRATS